jgi:hypothetical protein
VYDQDEEGFTFMKANLRHIVWSVAVAVGIGIGGAPVPAAGAPFFQDHEQDYSKNKNYQQGIRDGQDDKVHNRDHFRKRQFKNDVDRRAYEAGYQKGRH